MTLGEAVTRLGTRFAVDLDAEINTSDNDVMTAELMKAAKLVSRDTFFLFTPESALTLTNGTQEYNVESASISSKMVFHVLDVYINGKQIIRYENWQDFVDNCGDYHNASATANLHSYTLIAPNKILFNAPANATAAAYSGNFVTGFYLHDAYTYASQQNTELLGPPEFHDLIIDRAAIDCSKSYVAGQEGFARREMYIREYEEKARRFKAENLSRFKKARRRAGSGNTRRVYGIGSWR